MRLAPRTAEDAPQASLAARLFCRPMLVVVSGFFSHGGSDEAFRFGRHLRGLSARAWRFGRGRAVRPAAAQELGALCRRTEYRVFGGLLHCSLLGADVPGASSSAGNCGNDRLAGNSGSGAALKVHAQVTASAGYLPRVLPIDSCCARAACRRNDGAVALEGDRTSSAAVFRAMPVRVDRRGPLSREGDSGLFKTTAARCCELSRQSRLVAAGVGLWRCCSS
jgi:hypothetical protein